MTRSLSVPSLALGIVIGALLTAAWAFGSVPAQTASSSVPTVATSTAPVLTSSTSGAVSVQNQAAGSSVTIESITVPPPGVWVAVREVQGTELGNVLGAARALGPRTAFMVPLLRATTPGNTYAVELYRDNGNNVFDLTTDSVYVDFDSGDRVVSYFTTTP